LSKVSITFIRVKAKLHVAAAANNDDDNNELNTFLDRHSEATNTLTFLICAIASEKVITLTKSLLCQRACVAGAYDKIPDIYYTYGTYPTQATVDSC